MHSSFSWLRLKGAYNSRGRASAASLSVPTTMRSTSRSWSSRWLRTRETVEIRRQLRQIGKIAPPARTIRQTRLRQPVRLRAGNLAPACGLCPALAERHIEQEIRDHRRRELGRHLLGLRAGEPRPAGKAHPVMGLGKPLCRLILEKSAGPRNRRAERLGLAHEVRLTGSRSAR